MEVKISGKKPESGGFRECVVVLTTDIYGKLSMRVEDVGYLEGVPASKQDKEVGQ